MKERGAGRKEGRGRRRGRRVKILLFAVKCLK